MSTDDRHPADFLSQLASAIKAVRDRGGKWNKTADTIQWASERIERLESQLSSAQEEIERLKDRLGAWELQAKVEADKYRAAESRLEQCFAIADAGWHDEPFALGACKQILALRVVEDRGTYCIGCGKECGFLAARELLKGVICLDCEAKMQAHVMP